MASRSRAADVQVALQRAKTKISNLQQQLDVQVTSPEDTSPSWTPSKELQDSLVDMYQANPRVNVELRHCLTSPAAQPLSSPVRSWTSLSLDQPEQGPQHLLNRPSSCSPSPPLRRSVSPVSQSSSRPPGCGRLMDLDLSPSRGPSPLHDEGRGSGGPGSPAPRRHLVRSDDSSQQQGLCGPIMTSGRLQTFDCDKNISFLLKELEGLRETNKKLQEELVQKEKELQRKEVEEELREEQREARGWERPAAALKEVLAAQRNRDQALMSRLLLANEERDEALLYVRQLQRLDNVPPQGSPDLDVDDLLQRVSDADSVQEIQQFGSVLVQRLLLARQRKNDITAQEMKAMMEERDKSTTRCKRLEQEVMQEREQRTSEMKPLREGSGHEDILKVESNVLGANDSSQDALAPQAPPLQVQVQQLLKEKQSVEAELQFCQEAEQEASERVRRLERLVEVLRKKVGTGSLRAVM